VVDVDRGGKEHGVGELDCPIQHWRGHEPTISRPQVANADHGREARGPEGVLSGGAGHLRVAEVSWWLKTSEQQGLC
jgi:hypothetical protein